MSSQILITGATGFIGRQLTCDLVAAGRTVRILARNRRKAGRLFGDTVEVFPGDLDDTDVLDRACRNMETVYHIAGAYQFGLRHRHEVWRTNVEGTENLLQAAAANGVARFVHLSSAGVLRKKTALPADTTLLDENDFPNRSPRFCSYKSSKWHAEQRVLAWARRGFPAVIASTTCPIGAGDEAPTPTGRMIRDFLQRRFPFHCHTGLNFIAVRDLSAGLQRVAEDGQPGERYLLGHENLWLKDFLHLLAHETGLTAPEICLPHALVRLIGCGGEIVDFLYPRDHARICLETALQSGHIQFFNNLKARTHLGWKPAVPIREMIREAVAWFRHDATTPLPRVTSPSVESHVR